MAVDTLALAHSIAQKGRSIAAWPSSQNAPLSQQPLPAVFQSRAPNMQVSFPPTGAVLNTPPFAIFRCLFTSSSFAFHSWRASVDDRLHNHLSFLRRDLNSDAAFANVQQGSDITDVLALAWQATTVEDRKKFALPIIWHSLCHPLCQRRLTLCCRRFAQASGYVTPGMYTTSPFPQ